MGSKVGMGAKALKKHLSAVDRRIVGLLTKAKYKKLVGATVRYDIVVDGDVGTLLDSVNGYDATVLRGLSVTSSTDVNDRLLRLYARARRDSEHVARKYLGKVRRLRARIKNGF